MRPSLHNSSYTSRPIVAGCQNLPILACLAGAFVTHSLTILLAMFAYGIPTAVVLSLLVPTLLEAWRGGRR
jgi:hypothetical protein